jgi:hypothetical protein
LMMGANSSFLFFLTLLNIQNLREKKTQMHAYIHRTRQRQTETETEADRMVSGMKKNQDSSLLENPHSKEIESM